MELRGTLDKQDFAGGVWVLRTDDGASFELRGDVPPKLLGRRVRVVGEEAAAAFGFAMVGPAVDVRTVEPA